MKRKAKAASSNETLLKLVGAVLESTAEVEWLDDDVSCAIDDVVDEKTSEPVRAFFNNLGLPPKVEAEIQPFVQRLARELVIEQVRHYN